MKTIALRISIITCGVIFVSFAISCHQGGSNSSTSTSQASLLKEQLDAIHDETMGKIAPVRRVEDSLREQIKSFTTENKDTSALSLAANALDRCDTAMFGWMGRYHDQTMSADSSKTDLLNQHLQSLKQLDAATDSAIIQGRALLQ